MHSYPFECSPPIHYTSKKYIYIHEIYNHKITKYRELAGLQSIQIGMACSNVFSLEVLKLGIDVEPITGLHGYKYQIQIPDILGFWGAIGESQYLHGGVWG
jgi:hypothetical protein